MRFRRWLRCMCLAVLLLLAGATISFLTLSRPRINKTGCDRLDRLGLQATLVDVHRLVNAPPGDYSGGFRMYDMTSSGGNEPAALAHENAVFRCPADLAAFQLKWPQAKLVAWWGRNCFLVVEVDGRDNVIASSYGYCQHRPEDWLAGLFWSIDRWLDGDD